MLTQVGLGGRLDTSRRMSGGEQQRVALPARWFIARALAAGRRAHR
jgi:predicted ABC-type transport system involved in lysophospholipase L1 biosynthesis ATPase subunit